MASPYLGGGGGQQQSRNSQPSSPVVGFNPISGSQQSSHPGSPVQNLHSSASSSSLRNSLLSGNYALQQHGNNKNNQGHPHLAQHQSQPSLSSLAHQQQQQQPQFAAPAAGPAALAYANAQLNNFAASQKTDNNQAAAFYATNPAAASPNQQQQQQYPQQQNQQQQQQQHQQGGLMSPSSSSGSSNANANLVMSSPTNSRPLSMGSNTGAAAFAPQMTQLPPGLDLTALNIHSTNSSAPASAASSPGWSHRRLPSGSHHFVGGPAGSGPSAHNHAHPTPHHNPRVAASSITGKRLNWGEMITATIAHSEHGRLVIQDLFEQMCQRFPEVQEWAFGKDWEARVKNRIKSTLSIKGHLFVKVPRPSSAAGKGSWWTLSQEARDAFRENRLAPLLKLSSAGPGATASASHSRSGSRTDNFSMSAAPSEDNSRYNSPGPASGAATPIRNYAAPHPLTAAHVDPASANTANDKTQQQQAQQAAQLAQLQAHLLRQQQQQREALPGSYDPNAPPSFAANLPSNFYNLDDMAGLTSGPGLGNPGSNPSSLDQPMLSSSVDRNLLQALQAYGTSFGGGTGQIPQGAMDIDNKNALSTSNNNSGDSIMSSGSFGSNSFDATWRNLTMTGLGGDNPSYDWKQNRLSDPNAADSVDSASASSNSGYTNTTSGGAGTASSSSASASSYGIGSPQSMAHLGGPQSMPFPAPQQPQSFAAQQQGNNGRDTNSNNSQPSSAKTITEHDRGNLSQSGPVSNPFDFSTGSGASNPMTGPAGPGGMYPYSAAMGGNGNPGAQGNFDPSNPGGGDHNGQFAAFPGGNRFFSDPNQAALIAAMHGHQPQTNNPFGAQLPGGYAMPIPGSGNRGPHPYSQQSNMGGFDGMHVGNTGGMGNNTNGDGSTMQGNGDGGAFPPPSPAGSFSAFFAYTPATGPVDTPGQRNSREGSEAGSGSAGGHGRSDSTGESALGPMIGSRRRTSAAAGTRHDNSSGDSAYKYTSGGNDYTHNHQPSNNNNSSNTDNNPSSRGQHLAKVEEGFQLPPPATS